MKQRLKEVEAFIEATASPEHKGKILLADGLEDGFIGLAERDGVQVAVYGITSCIIALIKANKWSLEEAEEYFHFNTLNAYVGEYSPLFIDEMHPDE